MGMIEQGLAMPADAGLMDEVDAFDEGMEPPSSADLLRAIEEHESRASARGSLADDRQEAMDRYMGRPYGDEEEGRSHVVMRDVADTVEWIKPSLLKIFASGDEVVRFDPVGPEDEEQSQQETDYVNHVLMGKAAGFMVLHDWFHDALVQRNGYVWARSVSKQRESLERYQGLSDDEFAALMQSPGLELVEHSERVEVQQTTAGPFQARFHDVAVRSVVRYSCIEACNVAPERVLVHPDWSSLTLQDCPFTEVIDTMSISDLRQMGYDVSDEIDDTSQYNEDQWSMQRREVSEDGQLDESDEQGASRRVRVRFVWIRHDVDGDGIAELRRVVVCGSTLLEDEEDDIVPVAALCPFRLPHEHVGQSVDDLVQDLQRIRTVLVRGFLDGMYLSMHGRNAIDINRVNLDDMLVTRPGGVVRVNGSVGDGIMPLIQPSNGASLLQAVEYIDGVRENRTGVTRYNQGLDANSLNKTAHGISQIMTASQQRIELIARVFAETGIKALMLIIHAMSIKNGRQAEMIRLRGKWVQVDPRQWKQRQDLTISVGIGTGNKDQMLQHLMMILQEQKQGLAAGLTTPAQIFNTLKRLTQNAGFKQAEEFWSDPAQMEQKPPPDPMQSPEMLKVQMQEQNKLRIKMLELAADVLKTQAQAGMVPPMGLPEMAQQIDQLAGAMGPM